MKIGPLLAHLHELETGLARRAARRGRASARRARRLPPVPHLRAGRGQASREARAARRRYDGKAEWTTSLGDGSGDLLEELRTLYLRTQEVAITWTMAAQAAKALRDRNC